jgi:hypothetical protein
MREEAIRQAERKCHEAVRLFQAALLSVAEMQPLELAEAIAEGQPLEEEGQPLEDWPELCRLAEAVHQAAQEVEELQGGLEG